MGLRIFDPAIMTKTPKKRRQASKTENTENINCYKNGISITLAEKKTSITG